jgi:hypothetical protein
LKGARRGFAGARPGNRALSGYLDLQRRVDDSRVIRSSPYTGRLYVHQFRIRAPAELDGEFAGWIHEACQVGNGAHLGSRPRTTLARDRRRQPMQRRRYTGAVTKAAPSGQVPMAGSGQISLPSGGPAEPPGGGQRDDVM